MVGGEGVVEVGTAAGEAVVEVVVVGRVGLTKTVAEWVRSAWTEVGLDVGCPWCGENGTSITAPIAVSTKTVRKCEVVSRVNGANALFILKLSVKQAGPLIVRVVAATG